MFAVEVIVVRRGDALVVAARVGRVEPGRAPSFRRVEHGSRLALGVRYGGLGRGRPSLAARQLVGVHLEPHEVLLRHRGRPVQLLELPLDALALAGDLRRVPRALAVALG